jgi:HD superfamily phosphohydrolase
MRSGVDSERAFGGILDGVDVAFGGVDAGTPLDVPGRPSMPESSTRVVVDGDVRRLHEESPLVQGLQAAQDVQWRAGVYTPERHVETVEAAAERTFGLDA